MRGCIRLAVIATCALFVAVAQAAEPPRWVRNGKPTRQAQELTRTFEDAERFGLSPDSYRSRLSAAQLEAVLNGTASSELLHRYDRELSDLSSRFVHHLRYGRVEPRAAGFDLPAAAAGSDREIMERLANTDNVEATLASLEPRPAPYRLLKRALVHYRQLARDRAIHLCCRCRCRAGPWSPAMPMRARGSYEGNSSCSEILQPASPPTLTAPE